MGVAPLAGGAMSDGSGAHGGTDASVLAISAGSGQTEAHASRNGGYLHTSSHNTNASNAYPAGDRGSDTAGNLSVATEVSPEPGAAGGGVSSSGASAAHFPPAMHGSHASHVSIRSSRSTTYDPPHSGAAATVVVGGGSRPVSRGGAAVPSQRTPHDSLAVLSEMHRQRALPGEIPGSAGPEPSAKSAMSGDRSIDASSSSAKMNVRALQTTVHNAVSDMQSDLNDEALRVYDVLGQGGFGTVYHGAVLHTLNSDAHSRGSVSESQLLCCTDGLGSCCFRGAIG